MDRLRSRKAEVAGQFEQLRAAARFEAPPEKAAVSLDVLDETAARPPAGRGAAATATGPAEVGRRKLYGAAAPSQEESVEEKRD